MKMNAFFPFVRWIQRSCMGVNLFNANWFAFSQGWMNEISNYDPETYHATLTQSVYVRLEGSIIRLSKPNRNIARRAVHSEPKPEVTYISQKIYDLTNCKVCFYTFSTRT